MRNYQSLKSERLHKSFKRENKRVSVNADKIRYNDFRRHCNCKLNNMEIITIGAYAERNWILNNITKINSIRIYEAEIN